MEFNFDGSREMWSTLTLVGSLAFMFAYGVFRREHTRVWPILMIGVILDIATQVWFRSRSESAPGLYAGFFLFPLYCTVATVGGIMTRVGVEALLTMGRSKSSGVVKS